MPPALLDRPIFSSPTPLDSVVEAARHLAGLSGLEWRAVGGGASGARLWRCEADERPLLVVRRWPDSVDAQTIARRQDWLRRLAERTRLVAAPTRLIPDDPRWEASRWIAGQSIGAEPSDAGLDSIAEALAEWHAAARRVDGAFAETWEPFRGRLDPIRGVATGPKAAAARGPWADAIREFERRLPLAAAAALSVAARFAGDSLVTQTVHGDARPEHFLLDGGRVTGVIDHGAVRRDTPLADVARFAAEIDPAGGAVRLAWFGAWDRVTGAKLDRELMDALEAIAAVRTAENWRRWLAEGAPATADAATVNARLARVRRRLDRLLA